MTTRIYAVTPVRAETETEGGATILPLIPRLVRAHNQAQALRHVVRDFQATVASQDELVAALGAGVKVETAGVEAQGTPAASTDQALGDELGSGLTD